MNRGRFGWRGKHKARGRARNSSSPSRKETSPEPCQSRLESSKAAYERETEVSVMIKNISPLWGIYWPNEECREGDRRVNLIQSICRYLKGEDGLRVLIKAWEAAKISGSTVSLPLDAINLQDNVADLGDALRHAPNDALACIEIATFDSLSCLFDGKQLFKNSSRIRCFKVRLNNYFQNAACLHDSIDSIKADRVGRLVTVRGTVTRISPVKVMVSSMNFRCLRCGNVSNKTFLDGVYEPLAVCSTEFCRSKLVKPIQKSAKCVDWQTMHIQALPIDEKRKENSLTHASALPSHPIEIELCGDLAESCYPADVVSITGIVKVSRSDFASRGADAKRPKLFLPYIQAIAVRRNENMNNSNSEEVVIAPESISYLPPTMPGFTAKDLSFIRTFAEKCQGFQFETLVHSLAPGIYGLALIKSGLILSLFGGIRSKETAASKSSNKVRGDIHVLLVGDPGLGKSKLLQAVAAVAPRGVFVCGPSASASGLTISVNRNGGEISLEAGAMVTADRGVCCIDEFDKVSSEHTALLGALEQQEATIAKAGLVASLPARTTVVAAANPVDGHYNRRLTLSQNLKMTPAMISRFDLVFLMLDKPNEEADRKLAGHIITSKTSKSISESFNGSFSDIDEQLLTQRRNVAERLEAPLRCDPLPIPLLRKLIAYARQYVHPRLSNESKKIIQEFYSRLRQKSAGDISSPAVTHRLLESVIRLSEARARIELRDEVIATDALDAIDIIEETLWGSLFAGPGTIVFDKHEIGAKGAKSQAARFKQERRRFLEAVRKLCACKSGSDLEVHELFSIADQIELAVEDTGGFIEYLNNQGDLLKKGNGVFKFNG